MLMSLRPAWPTQLSSKKSEVQKKILPQKAKLEGCRVGSVVKRVYRFRRGPEIGFHYLRPLAHNLLQLQHSISG